MLNSLRKFSAETVSDLFGERLLRAGSYQSNSVFGSHPSAYERLRITSKASSIPDSTDVQPNGFGDVVITEVLLAAVGFDEAAFARKVVGIGAGDAFRDWFPERAEERGPECREIAFAVSEIHWCGGENMTSAAVHKGFVDQF